MERSPVMFRSQTYGKLNMDQIAEKILEFHDRTKTFDGELQVTVGTDSQNFDKTKVVSVIAAYKEGHGGIFFYEVTMIPRISDVARKLNEETSRSLSVIMDLAEKLEGEKYQGLRENTVLSVHIDAGWSEKGKTKELIPGLVGWIRACEYDCRVKPDSYAASSRQDKQINEILYGGMKMLRLRLYLQLNNGISCPRGPIWQRHGA